jgi:hypothetical protein
MTTYTILIVKNKIAGWDILGDKYDNKTPLNKFSKLSNITFDRINSLLSTVIERLSRKMIPYKLEIINIIGEKK